MATKTNFKDWPTHIFDTESHGNLICVLGYNGSNTKTHRTVLNNVCE